MEKPGGLPWSRPDVFVQLVILVGVAAYAGVAIALVYWPLVILYAGLWATFIVSNHYYVCRDCQYCGTLCGSFGLGRLALFTRTDKEHFDPRKSHRSMVVFCVTAVFPVPVLLFLQHSWLWIVIYLAGEITFLVAHNRLGCARCPLVHCALNPRHRKGAAIAA